MSTDASRDRDEIVEVMKRLVETEGERRAAMVREWQADPEFMEALHRYDAVVEKVEGFEDGTGSRSRAPHPSRDATKGVVKMTDESNNAWRPTMQERRARVAKVGDPRVAAFATNILDVMEDRLERGLPWDEWHKGRLRRLWGNGVWEDLAPWKETSGEEPTP